MIQNKNIKQLEKLKKLHYFTTKMEDDEKDLELKDLLIQTLETNGLLAKMKVSFIIILKLFLFYMNSFKAQIRANVFLALDENEKNSNTVGY